METPAKSKGAQAVLSATSGPTQEDIGITAISTCRLSVLAGKSHVLYHMAALLPALVTSGPCGTIIMHFKC